MEYDKITISISSNIRNVPDKKNRLGSNIVSFYS